MAASPGSRRFGAAFVAILLAGGATTAYVSLRGEKRPTPTAQVVGGSQTDETMETDSKASDHDPTKALETYEVFAPKDPFAPLVAGSAAAATALPERPEGGVTATFESESSGDHRIAIKLISTDGKSVELQIDGAVFAVKEGELFADHFQLIGVADECASILYGDDQFTLCEGEEILK